MPHVWQIRGQIILSWSEANEKSPDLVGQCAAGSQALSVSSKPAFKYVCACGVSFMVKVRPREKVCHHDFFQDVVISRHLYIWYSHFWRKNHLCHHTFNQLCCSSKSRGMCDVLIMVHMPRKEKYYGTNTQSSNGETALDVVSYIGCAISLACLLLSLLTFLVFGWVYISHVGLLQLP